MGTRVECRRLSCLLSPPSTLDTDTLNTYCSMDDADDTFYSIKDIKQINDEEFEAVFEFDSNEGEAIGLSESDIHMLEALKSQDLLILGTEDEADTEEDPGESLSKFQNVLEQFIEQNSPETSKSTADHDVPSRSSKSNHRLQRNSETRKSKKNLRVRCPTPLPQDQEELEAVENDSSAVHLSDDLKNEEDEVETPKLDELETGSSDSVQDEIIVHEDFELKEQINSEIDSLVKEADIMLLSEDNKQMDDEADAEKLATSQMDEEMQNENVFLESESVETNEVLVDDEQIKDRTE